MTISSINNRIKEINNRIVERSEELESENNPYIEMDNEIINLNNELVSLKNEMEIAKREVYAYSVQYKREKLEKELEDANNRFNERQETLVNNDVDYTSQYMDEISINISNEI